MDPIDPSVCPICGERNECGLVAGAGNCWCFISKVPEDVLERVPPEARGIACVCRYCATGQDSPSKKREQMLSVLRNR